LNSIVDKVELFTESVRNGKYIIFGVGIEFVELEDKAIACGLEMGNQLIARIPHESKEISINTTLGTVVVEVLREFTFIDSGTSIIAELPLGVPDPSHVNVIYTNNPALFVMITGHVRHVVNGVHVIGRRDVTVHHVVG
jgi:hypothetical protein